MNEEDPSLCAVSAMWDYCKVRGVENSPLFMFQDKQAVSRQHFNQQLRTSLTFQNLDIKHYKGHSFRIGAASWAKSKSVRDEQIQL